MARTFTTLQRKPRGKLAKTKGKRPDWFGTAKHYRWQFFRRGTHLFASVTNGATPTEKIVRLDDYGNEVAMKSTGDLLAPGQTDWYEVRETT